MKRFLFVLLIFIQYCSIAFAADQTLNDKTESTNPGSGDYMYLYTTAGTDRKVKLSNAFSHLGATSLTGLTDMGNATVTSGRMLVADGTKFNSVALSGSCSIDSAGVISCSGGSGSGATQLTGLSDVGSATATAGRLLVADGTKFQAVVMSGSCTITNAGVITCPNANGATQLTGLSDVGSATATAGRLLIADGTKYQSVSTTGSFTIQAASSNTNIPIGYKAAYTKTVSTMDCFTDSGTSVALTIKQCCSNYAQSVNCCNILFNSTTCDQDGGTASVVSGASVFTSGNVMRADIGTVTGTVNGLGVTIK